MARLELPHGHVSPQPGPTDDGGEHIPEKEDSKEEEVSGGSGEQFAATDGQEGLVADVDLQRSNQRSDSKSADGRPHAASQRLHSRVQDSCLIVLAVLAVLYTLYFTRSLLLPVTLAVLLNLVLKPVIIRLERLGLPNFVSATIVLIVMSATAALSVSLLWNPAKQWIAESPRNLQQVGRQLRAYVEPFERLDDAKKRLDEITSSRGEEAAVPVRIEQPRLSSQMANPTGAVAGGVAVTLLLLFFLLAAGDRFLEKTVEMVPTWRGKRDTVALFREIQQKMSAYLGTITLINIGLGVVIGLGLWLIGIPNPVLWGVLAAVLNYIPFAGLIVGTLIVSLVAIAEFGSVGRALLAPIIYLTANGVEANLVTPLILGRSVSLDPVIILLSIFVGGWIWGVGGIFLAVPTLLVVKIACDNYQELKPLGAFLGR